MQSTLARLYEPGNSVCKIHSHVSMNPEILYAKYTRTPLSTPKFCMQSTLARVYQPRNSVCKVHSHVSMNPRSSVCKVHSHVSVKPEMRCANYTRMCPVTAITMTVFERRSKLGWYSNDCFRSLSKLGWYNRSAFSNLLHLPWGKTARGLGWGVGGTSVDARKTKS